MRIIQSFWSGNRSDPVNYPFGWISNKYNLISWSLSISLLKKQYENVELITDDAGKKLLIDGLKLPYDKVDLSLNELSQFNSGLWAIGKILSYSIQKEPFLHIDGDVFISNSFDENLLKKGLIAQNLEIGGDDYTACTNYIKSEFDFVPESILKNNENEVKTYNAGIFGGCDIDFIKLYSREAFDFVEKNEEALSKFHKPSFNVYFEQLLFYCLGKNRGKKVSCLFKEPFENTYYEGFANFYEFPMKRGYLHPVGRFKRSLNVSVMMECHLATEFPNQYEILIDYLIDHQCFSQRGADYSGRVVYVPDQDLKWYFDLRTFVMSIYQNKPIILLKRSNHASITKIRGSQDNYLLMTLSSLGLQKNIIDDFDFEILKLFEKKMLSYESLTIQLSELIKKDTSESDLSRMQSLLFNRIVNLLVIRALEIEG